MLFFLDWAQLPFNLIRPPSFLTQNKSLALHLIKKEYYARRNLRKIQYKKR